MRYFIVTTIIAMAAAKAKAQAENPRNHQGLIKDQKPSSQPVGGKAAVN